MSSNIMLSKLRIAVALLVLIVAIPAKLAGAAEPVRYKCTFERYASLDEGLKRVKKLFEFELAVDSITNDAVMIGNAGVSSTMSTVDGPYAITFLEPLATGVVQSTTIIKATGEAVHSRHTYLSLISEFVPSQYYGSCKKSK